MATAPRRRASIKASAKRRSHDARPRSRSGASRSEYPAPRVPCSLRPGRAPRPPRAGHATRARLDAARRREARTVARCRAGRPARLTPPPTACPADSTTGPRPTARVWWSAGLGSCAASWRRTRTRRCPRALARVEPMLPELEAGPMVACHGDFHPLNVLVDGDTSMVIDWTDAALGDRHGDVARTSLLFYFGAALATSNRAAKAVLGGVARLARRRRYLGAYRAIRTDRPRSPPALGGGAPAPRMGAGRRGARSRRRARRPRAVRAAHLDRRSGSSRRSPDAPAADRARSVAA